jgi:hypothetical protein
MGTMRRWVRRGSKILGVGVLLLAVLFGCVVAANPRSEDDFLRNTSRRTTIADGEAACDWLRTQIPHLLNPTREVGSPALPQRYGREEDLEGTEVARQAWEHLCGATRDLMVISHPWEYFTMNGGSGD